MIPNAVPPKSSLMLICSFNKAESQPWLSSTSVEQTVLQKEQEEHPFRMAASIVRKCLALQPPNIGPAPHDSHFVTALYSSHFVATPSPHSQDTKWACRVSKSFRD